jgi:hypothetical protein
VGCSKNKLPHAAPAGELYCSPLFRACRRWAERNCDVWAILSARHGVVTPDKVLEPYNTRLADRRPHGVNPPLNRQEMWHWLYAAVQAWRCQYAAPTRAAPLVILAGKDYWEPLAGRMPFEIPLDGLGIGDRLKWLKVATAVKEASLYD